MIAFILELGHGFVWLNGAVWYRVFHIKGMMTFVGTLEFLVLLLSFDH